MTIGYFNENNKDDIYIRSLLKTNKYHLIVFAQKITELLSKFKIEFPDTLSILVDYNTYSIMYFQSFFNINYLLFTPPENSDFHKSQWSASIAFAIDNNIKLVIPEDIAKIYNLNENIVVYPGTLIHNNTLSIRSKEIDKDLLQDFRNNNYNKNVEFIKNLLKI
jgi:hypothetical protein